MIAHIFLTGTNINTNITDVVDVYTKISPLSNSTVMHITPLEGKTELLVEQIRDLRNELRYMFTQPVVVVLSSVDNSSAEVQNMLLKLLEEHQENIHLILLVASLHLLVPPIVSRCRILTFGKNNKSLTQWSAEIDTTKLTKESVEEFLLYHATQSTRVADLAFFLRQRQLLLANNVAPQSIYDSVLIFLQKRSSINT